MLNLEALLSASARSPCYCSNFGRIRLRANSSRPSCWSCRLVMSLVPRPLSAQKKARKKAWTRNRLDCIQTRDLSSLIFPPMPTSPRISMRQENAWPARLFVFVPTATPLIPGPWLWLSDCCHLGCQIHPAGWGAGLGMETMPPWQLSHPRGGA